MKSKLQTKFFLCGVLKRSQIDNAFVPDEQQQQQL